MSNEMKTCGCYYPLTTAGGVYAEYEKPCEKGDGCPRRNISTNANLGRLQDGRIEGRFLPRDWNVSSLSEFNSGMEAVSSASSNP